MLLLFLFFVDKLPQTNLDINSNKAGVSGTKTSRGKEKQRVEDDGLKVPAKPIPGEGNHMIQAKKNDTVENVGTSSEQNTALKRKLEEEPKAKSWSQVVGNASLGNNLTLDYVPPQKGSKLVSPPLEILRKGNDKFKTCIVGTFSRGTVPLSKVTLFAQKSWDSRGLEHISQKDKHTFVFRFSNVAAMNQALARGTWYVENKPMLVHAWGSSPGTGKSMPLWVKFEQIPDCYWTREEIGRAHV